MAYRLCFSNLEHFRTHVEKEDWFLTIKHEFAKQLNVPVESLKITNEQNDGTGAKLEMMIKFENEQQRNQVGDTWHDKPYLKKLSAYVSNVGTQFLTVELDTGVLNHVHRQPSSGDVFTLMVERLKTNIQGSAPDIDIDSEKFTYMKDAEKVCFGFDSQEKRNEAYEKIIPATFIADYSIIVTTECYAIGLPDPDDASHATCTNLDRSPGTQRTTPERPQTRQQLPASSQAATCQNYSKSSAPVCGPPCASPQTAGNSVSTAPTAMTKSPTVQHIGLPSNVSPQYAAGTQTPASSGKPQANASRYPLIVNPSVDTTASSPKQIERIHTVKTHVTDASTQVPVIPLPVAHQQPAASPLRGAGNSTPTSIHASSPSRGASTPKNEQTVVPAIPSRGGGASPTNQQTFTPGRIGASPIKQPAPLTPLNSDAIVEPTQNLLLASAALATAANHLGMGNVTEPIQNLLLVTTNLANVAQQLGLMASPNQRGDTTQLTSTNHQLAGAYAPVPGFSSAPPPIRLAPTASPAQIEPSTFPRAAAVQWQAAVKQGVGWPPAGATTDVGHPSQQSTNYDIDRFAHVRRDLFPNATDVQNDPAYEPRTVPQTGGGYDNTSKKSPHHSPPKMASPRDAETPPRSPYISPFQNRDIPQESFQYPDMPSADTPMFVSPRKTGMPSENPYKASPREHPDFSSQPNAFGQAEGGRLQDRDIPQQSPQYAQMPNADFSQMLFPQQGLPPQLNMPYQSPYKTPIQFPEASNQNLVAAQFQGVQPPPDPNGYLFQAVQQNMPQLAATSPTAAASLDEKYRYDQILTLHGNVMYLELFDKSSSEPFSRAISSLRNTGGGTLLLGVNKMKQVKGLALETCSGEDAARLQIDNVFKQMYPSIFPDQYTVKMLRLDKPYDGKVVVKISINACSEMQADTSGEVWKLNKWLWPQDIFDEARKRLEESFYSRKHALENDRADFKTGANKMSDVKAYHEKLLAETRASNVKMREDIAAASGRLEVAEQWMAIHGDYYELMVLTQKQPEIPTLDPVKQLADQIDDRGRRRLEALKHDLREEYKRTGLNL